MVDGDGGKQGQQGQQSSATADGPAQQADAGLLARARSGDPLAVKMLRNRRKKKREAAAGAGSAASVDPGNGGADDGEQAAPWLKTIDADPMVTEVDADGQLKDAEAEAARRKLSAKITATERAIREGAMDALVAQFGADTKKKKDGPQGKVVDAIKKPLQKRLIEFVSKGLDPSPVKMDGAAKAALGQVSTTADERALSAATAEKATSAVVGKMAGQVATGVGIVHGVVEAVHSSEVAEFKADTWQGLTAELRGNLAPAFDEYQRRVAKMTAQEAVDAAAGETVDPWVTQEHVKQVLLRLFTEAEIQSSVHGQGPLQGFEVVDKVQEMLHPEPEGN